MALKRYRVKHPGYYRDSRLYREGDIIEADETVKPSSVWEPLDEKPVAAPAAPAAPATAPAPAVKAAAPTKRPSDRDL